jgi:ketosteroid isomerase-like protein
MMQRQQALHDRAIDRIAPLISPSYQDKGFDAQAKITEIANTLASWDSIDMQGDPPAISISGDTARVKQNYRLRVKKKDKELTLDGEANLSLRREPSGWKIVCGL